MVEFCRQCGGSLAHGDLTFWMGEVFTSADYPCPFCGKRANPETPKIERPPIAPPGHDEELVFRDGKSESKPVPPERQ
jgi:hypothetical protein